MKKLFLFFCLIFFSAPAFADFKATVSRTTMPEGESFQLYLRQNGDAEQPDVSVLNKDFTVVGQRKSYKTSIVNGKAEKYNENILTLIPKKTGTVVLPAIYAGKEHTSPATLTVVPAGTTLPASATPAQKQAARAKVFLRAALSDEKPFVAQQVVYTVRLYTGEDTVLLDGGLTPPAADGVSVEQWGDMRRSKTLIDEVPYNVLEYRFLLFPQKSGKIALTAPRFQGIVSDPDADRDTDFFGFHSPLSGLFGQKNIAVRAGDAVLDVRPKPAAVGENWLPASNVEIAEETSAAAEVALGEAVTRTVSVAANGVLATQIPDPIFPAGEGYKLYPGQADSKNLFDEKGVIGVKTRQIVFMPTKTGEIVLPAMELQWFDIKTQTPKTAVLPSKTIKVTGTAPAEKTSVSSTAAAPAAEPAPPQNAVAPLPVRQDIALDYRLFFAGMLAGAGLMTLVWLIVSRFAFVRVRKAEVRQTVLPRRNAENALKQACAANDAVAARISLLQVAALYWENNPPLTLSGIADRFGDAVFAGQIDALNTVLYAPAPVEWSGKSLWAAFKNTKAYRRSAAGEKSVPVPPLYPT